MKSIDRYESLLPKKSFSLLDVSQHQRMMILGDIEELEKKTKPSFDLLDAKQKQRLEILGRLD